VTRLFLPGGSVISKEPLGPDADRRLRHEVAILSRLAGVAGVVQLADAPPRPGAMLLVDVGGLCLARTSMPWAAGDLTDLALGLARAVAGMHRGGVMHTDISPANIVVGDSPRHPFLIDFALAATFAAARPRSAAYREIVGTLPYLAPELTGRTGHVVDERADLYALGATLYELATGGPPFGTGDPLKLVHDHLARVPVPPAEVNPTVPAGLSAVIMHLLEKEPDNRYQTADGLIHDLARLREGVATLHIGERDFPLRLRPPSRIVGRSTEIAALGAAFAGGPAGRRPGVLVSGAPGVGKTSLVEELRPLVMAGGGWFVSGKFDQYRRDLEFDGVAQGFRALGRLLLALPEEELAEARTRILRALGHSAGLAAAVTPELASLLRVPPEMGDPLTAQVRAQRNSVEILRAVASDRRPVVFVVDDLQWASRTPLGLFDLVLSGEEVVEGLLLVGAYREDDVDPAHPLAALLARWRRQEDGPEHLRLGNLPASSVAALVADMLAMDVGDVGELAEAVAQRTNGNPYETVEYLNALRRDGVLRPEDKGWHWDTAGLRRGAGPVDLPDLLGGRVAAMPPATRSLVEVMACLGGRVELSLLEAAADVPAAVAAQRLAPALDDGLLMTDAGGQAIRFRHDRVREAALACLAPRQRRAVRLQLARRLAIRPDLFAVAAEQYLHAVDAVDAPDERRQMVELFRRAAGEARLVSNYAVMEGLLSAAVRVADAADSAVLIELHTGRLAALYGLGRLDEADEAFRTVERLSTDPLQRTEATLVQISSLTNRTRPAEALDLGMDLLRRLGVVMPPPELIEIDIERGLDEIYGWLDQSGDADDLARPEFTKPALLATAVLINRLMPASFQSDPSTMVWLVLQAARMWVEHGPAQALVGPVGHIPFATTRRRQDYRTGYRLMRRVMAVGEARGYEPDTSQARFLFAFGAGHWFAPLEECVEQARRAWDGLLQGGDLQNACWTADVLVYALLDCASSLDAYIPEVEAALAFARRTGNDHSAQLALPYLWLVCTLRGERAEEPVHLDGGADVNPTVASNIHITRALAAALLDDPAGLDRHSSAAMALLPFIENLYLSTSAYLTRGLALAGRVRVVGRGTAEHAAALADLDTVVAWWAERAGDAPANFQHLLRLIEAERAWAVDDFHAAARAFDAAQRDAETRQRPWHRALITERAARFYLAHGVEHTGRALLAEACRAYQAWGAVAKVNQLRQAHPGLMVADGALSWPATGLPADAPAHRASIMTGAIDLLGILAASQALSSETSLDGLREKVVEVLSTMTGATGVQLLLWNGEHQTWQMPALSAGTPMLSLDEAGRRRLVPLSVVRYVERTREPLVVVDAAADDRFARDPYFSGYQCCSLLAVPIFNRATPQALLLLENQLIRGAFSAERLDGVMLIAGQLTVSLDNALVYASLEHKVAERTRQLAVANERLEQLSITDPLTGLANRRRFEDVLHTEWERACRTGMPLALAMIDVDHFKLYNDHYGHPAGDECLHRVATLLKRHTSTSHLVARYGGEEFAVVMPDTGIRAAWDIAERLRTAVVTLAEPHHLVADRVVTASIGVAATTPASDTSADHLVELADVELYRAKRAGRNRVKAAGLADGQAGAARMTPEGGGSG
jgi:diguanylate cyclase (GGDEF)-like protein